MLLSFSCNNVEKENNVIDSMGFDIDVLKKSIILNGDVSAYEILSTKFIKREKYLDILPLSFVMAIEHNHSEAYYDVFYFLYNSNSNLCVDYDLSCLDAQTKKLALKYLKLGIDNGDEACSNVVLDFYDEGKYYPVKEIYSDVKLINMAKLNVNKL